MLSVKAQKIQSMLIADLKSILNKVYVNYEVSLHNETFSKINIDYNDFESFTFTFVNVRSDKDSYRVDLEDTSLYIFNKEDYQSALSQIIECYNSK